MDVKRTYTPPNFDFPVCGYCWSRQYDDDKRRSYTTDSPFCECYKIRQYSVNRRTHSPNFRNKDYPVRRYIRTIHDKNEKRRTLIPKFRDGNLPGPSEASIRKDKNVKRSKIENIDDGMDKIVCYSEIDFSESFDYINQLPDSLLLKIFSYLEFREVYMCLSVCKRWNRIADDNSLKKVVILTNPDVHCLPYLLSTCFTPYLEEFKLQNFVSADLPNFGRIESLNMSIKSKNMKKLELLQCSLYGITVYDLPTSIKHFSMKYCTFPFNTFFSIKSDCSVAQLTFLEIRGVDLGKDIRPNFSKLCVFKSLKMLSISYNYDITDEDVELMTEILPQLEVLNVEGTAISRTGLHLIFNTCFNVRELLIGECIRLRNDDLDPVLRSKIPHLSYLCVRNTSISLNRLHVFLSCCPERSSIKVDFFKRCLDCRYNNEISEYPYFSSSHLKFKHHSSFNY